MADVKLRRRSSGGSNRNKPRQAVTNKTNDCEDQQKMMSISAPVRVLSSTFKRTNSVPTWSTEITDKSRMKRRSSSSHIQGRTDHNPTTTSRRIKSAHLNSTYQLSQSAPGPLQLGSIGGRFSSTSKFKRVPLPSIYSNTLAERTSRPKSVSTQRWIVAPPNPYQHTGGAEAYTLEENEGNTTRFIRECEELERIRMTKAAATHAGHRKIQPYLLCGKQITPLHRGELEEEELLTLDRLDLAPAPELYVGKSLNAEARPVRARQARRAAKPITQKGSVLNPPEQLTAGDTFTAKRIETEIRLPTPQTDVPSDVRDDFGDDHRPAYDKTAESETFFSTKETDTADTRVPTDTMENSETAVSRVASGWEGTVLSCADPPADELSLEFSNLSPGKSEETPTKDLSQEEEAEDIKETPLETNNLIEEDCGTEVQVEAEVSEDVDPDEGSDDDSNRAANSTDENSST